MSDRDDVLPDLAAARADIAAAGLRRYAVTVRKRTWSGGAPGVGSVTPADSAITPAPRVRSLSAREVASSGGTFLSGDLRIDRITPAFAAIRSPVTHKGSGTGTVTPSSSIPLTGLTQPGSFSFVVVSIQVGGPVGTATFQYSTDGGTTWSATITTVASYTVGGTGFVLAFAGSFAATDTYSFNATSGGWTPEQLLPAPTGGQDVVWLLAGDEGTHVASVIGKVEFARAFGYTVTVRPRRETPTP